MAEFEDLSWHLLDEVPSPMVPPLPTSSTSLLLRFDASLQPNNLAGIGLWCLLSKGPWEVHEVFKVGFPIARSKSINVLEALAATTGAFLLSSIL